MTFDDLKDNCHGQPAIIIGKGPSLDRIELIRPQLEQSAVLCCNQSIHAVEALDLQFSTIFCVQQDCELEGQCIPKHPDTGHFMSDCQFPGGDHSLGKMRVDESFYNPKAILYSESHFCAGHEPAAVAALRIAKHMGIKRVSFFAFDSWDQPHAHTESHLADYAACLGPSQVQKNRDMGYPRHHSNGVAIRWAATELMESVEVLKIRDGVVVTEKIK